MKATAIILGSILTLALASGGYFYVDQFKPIKAEHDYSLTKNNELEKKIVNLELELNQKVAELSKAKKEKEEEIKRVKSTKDSLISEMESEINENQIQITQMADKLKVSIVDKILFSSGRAEISPEGLKILKRVGDILKKSKDKIVRVEGHTDNVPISGQLKEKFPTNWELSTARATNVVRFLQEEVEMNPNILEAVGLGEFHPIADNQTPEGKAQNRRIEIALLPVK